MAPTAPWPCPPPPSWNSRAWTKGSRRGEPDAVAQLEALPETQVGEILRGEIFASPRPAPRQANVIAELCEGIVGPDKHGCGGPGGWWILPEPEVYLGTEVVVPDIALSTLWPD